MSLYYYPHITVKIVLDSLPGDTDPEARAQEEQASPEERRRHPARLTTFELTYPRFIHAELMTHRVLSRNAQSSRAIPATKRIERVKLDPVMPCRWGKNQKGMQPKDEDLEVDALLDAKAMWREAAKDAAYSAESLAEAGLHKQWVNRLLEPFDTITTIVTGTDWTNFFALRCHPTAQDEFQILAWKMAELYYEGEPPKLRDMHFPYLTEHALRDFREGGKPLSEHNIVYYYHYAMISAARCARVSYLNHDGSTPDEYKDMSLADRLLLDKHLSPFEHVAATLPRAFGKSDVPIPSGNFRSWIQFRKYLEATVLTPPSFNYDEAKTQYRPW